MTIDFNHYHTVKQQLNKDTTLCIVSKYHSIEEIQAYYDLGERCFGESHAQDLCRKANALPKDISWHFIGHLQSNKIKQILPYVSCIQSVDSLTLAKKIDEECKRQNKRVSILAQFHLATEDTNKYGLSYEEAVPFVKACQGFKNIDLCGIMVMGPHTSNQERIQEVFQQAHELFQTLNTLPDIHLTTLSMGMSDDYPIALACGSTMLRIGSYLFKGEIQ